MLIIHISAKFSVVWYLSIVLISVDVVPPARTRHAITQWDGSIIVYGGKDSNGTSLNDLWLFRPLKRSWKQVWFFDVLIYYTVVS